MDANGLNDWILWFFYSFFGTFEVHQMEVKDLPSSTNPEKTPTDIHVDFFGKKNVGEKNTQNLHDISQSLHDVPILFSTLKPADWITASETAPWARS